MAHRQDHLQDSMANNSSTARHQVDTIKADHQIHLLWAMFLAKWPQ